MGIELDPFGVNNYCVLCTVKAKKGEQKHVTKNFVEFHNHSPLLTMNHKHRRNKWVIEQGSRYHPAIKFTAEISDNESIFQDTCVYKGDKFKETSLLDTPPGVSKSFIKGKALRLLRTITPKIKKKKLLMTLLDNSNNTYT